MGVEVGAGWSRTLGSWQPWGQRKEEMGGGGGGGGDGSRVSMLVANSIKQQTSIRQQRHFVNDMQAMMQHH